MTDFGRDPHHIEVDGSHLLLSPYARDPHVRGDRTWPTVVSGPSQYGMKNEPPMIRDDLEDKASKFGRPEKPYVIAALCQRDFVDDLDLEEALFGPQIVTIPVGPNGPTGDARLGRDPRGFWQRGERKRATRVSAVLSAIHLHPWSAAVVPLQVWHNPWAAIPLEVELPWSAVDPDLVANHLVRREATTTPAELLGLSAN